jgi:hypothetical protein
VILLRHISLTNGLTLAAIKCLHHCGKYPRVPVIADTAVRFMPTGKDMATPSQLHRKCTELTQCLCMANPCTDSVSP